MTAKKPVPVARLLAALSAALEKEAGSLQVVEVAADVSDDPDGTRVELRATLSAGGRRPRPSTLGDVSRVFDEGQAKQEQADG